MVLLAIPAIPIGRPVLAMIIAGSRRCEGYRQIELQSAIAFLLLTAFFIPNIVFGFHPPWEPEWFDQLDRFWLLILFPIFLCSGWLCVQSMGDADDEPRGFPVELKKNGDT
jgi:hypothetical protein